MYLRELRDRAIIFLHSTIIFWIVEYHIVLVSPNYIIINIKNNKDLKPKKGPNLHNKLKLFQYI